MMKNISDNIIKPKNLFNRKSNSRVQFYLNAIFTYTPLN